MGQRQLHLLASHMRLRPGATADQVRTFPHVQPRPSPLRFHRYQRSIARFRVPARPPSARMASALHAHARHRWPSAFAQHSALTTFLCLSRFLTDLNVSFTTRCGTQFGTQVFL